MKLELIPPAGAVTPGAPSHFPSKPSRSHLFCMLLTPTKPQGDSSTRLPRSFHISKECFVVYMKLKSANSILSSLHRELCESRS